MEKILPQEAPKMDFSEYQQKALQFRLPSANEFYAVIGLGAEVGEVQDKVAKIIRDGQPTSENDQMEFIMGIAKELGDVLWFVAAIAADNGLDLGLIAEANIKKLESRQTRGVLTGSGDNR